MKILLDTHIYIWWLMESPKLSEAARRLIGQAEEIHVSTASLWEAAIKATTGKLEADIEDLRRQIGLNHFQILPVTDTHVSTFARLPLLHKDPFDRMLVAQSMAEPLRLITADKRLPQYTSMIELV